MDRKSLIRYVVITGGLVALLLASWLVGLIDFFRPVYLFGLLGLPLFMLIAMRSVAGLPRRTNFTALLFRSILFILLVIALADLQIVKRSNTLGVYFLMDYSASIPEKVREDELAYINRAVKTKRKKDLAGIIVFAEEPSIELAPDHNLEVASLHSAVNPDYTNMQSAVELATAAFPPGVRKKIVLISDGNQNIGDVVKATEFAASEQVELEVLPVAYAATEEVMADKLLLPEKVAENEAFDITFQVTSKQNCPGRITIFRNEQPVAEQDVILQKGRNPFTMSMRLDKPGFFIYTARITSDHDTILQNNEVSSYVYIQGNARVLFVTREGMFEEVEHLVEICSDEHLEPVVISSTNYPTRLEQLAIYDLILFANVPASDFSEPQMAMTQAAVRDLGIGFVMIGGENSFGAGGYEGSPVETLLPVSMDIKQRKIMPKGALVIVLHTCEFADGNYWGKEITKKALDTIQARDEAGVLYYGSGGVKWLFNLREATNKTYLKNLVSKCEPGDMPSFVPPFQKAAKALVSSDAMVKHIIVISDGDPARPNKTDIQTLANNGITVSCVAINPHSPRDVGVMKSISLLTKGRFYNVKDPKQLPKIFVKEARVVKRSLIYNKPFQPQLNMSSELVKGINQAEIPQLLAYVATTPKDRALVSMISEGENKDPIVAEWRYGLGKSVAFTSDASSNWGKHWISWDRYRKIWAQVIRWTTRLRRKSSLSINSQYDGNKVIMTVDAVDAEGNFVNFNNIDGRRVDSKNEGHRLEFMQVGPGRYQAEFDSRQGGVNLVNIFYADPAGGQGFVQSGVSVPYSPEYKKLQTNVPLLKRIAQKGSPRGELLNSDPSLAGIFESNLPPSVLPQPIWELLILIAVFLFMVDVIIRRVIITRADFTALASVLSGNRSAKTEQEHSETMSALLKRKEQATSKPRADGSEDFKARLIKEAKDTKGQSDLELEQSDTTLGNGKDSPSSTTAPSVPTAKPDKKDEPSYTNRLLDAKRRAQQKKDE